MFKFSLASSLSVGLRSLNPLWLILAGWMLTGPQVFFSALEVCAQEQGGAAETATVTHKPKVFERLWKVYPNKEGKEAAIQSWNKLQVSDEELDRMRAAFPLWRSSAEWTKGRGKYVPPLAKWLDERMWEKEPPLPAPLQFSEASDFLLQPLFLGPRLAFAVSGTLIGGLIWPVDQPTANKVWDASLNAPWVWHEFVSGQD